MMIHVSKCMLSRTVLAGDMITDVVSKGADKLNVIRINQTTYSSWSKAREAYRAVGKNGCRGQRGAGGGLGCSCCTTSS